MTNPPVTEEAVERVAKAICTANGEAHFEDNGFPEWRKYLPDARAAIAALKSPPVVSEEDRRMIENLRFLASKNDGPGGVCRVPQSNIRWAADRIEALAMSVKSEAAQGGQ